jgi:hypothetical protein
VLAKNNGHHNFILTKSGLPPALLQILGAAGASGKPNRGNPQYSYNLPYTDLNPFMRTYCDGLGVEIGSDWFLAYGCALYPGQTGGQPDFGWRQDHRIPPANLPEFDRAAKAILANAGYRPTFYLDSPDALRKGYGRPWDWVPDPLIDDVLTEGWKAPNGKLVVGHDAQHFSLKFLAALAANPVPNEYSNMAQAFMWRYASIVGGWLRTEYYQSLHSSREVGRLLDFVADVIDVAWMEPEDAVAIINWARHAVVPSIYPDGTGYVYYPGDQGYKPEPNLGTVPYSYPWQDGLMAPGMYRFGHILMDTNFPEFVNLGNDLVHQSRRVAAHVASLITDDGACPKAEGLDGKLSWVENEKYGYSVWCYRALRIAGAHAKADAVFARFKDDPNWWPWFVEADGSWNPNLPLAN